MNFDPDSDGFIFDLPLARQLHRNMNLLEFIRKRILSNKAKLFDQNSKALSINLSAPNTSSLTPVENWETKKHDKALLRAFSDHGYKECVGKFNES